jgi:NtrC-family two-component system response regulator AlgB
LQHQVRENQTQNPEIVLDFTEAPMKDIMDVLMRAAQTPASILISGASGTGKSIIARTIHDNSPLADHPFVTVSCPSLSKELLQSELFGHVRGAFTGAVKDHWGKVKAANGGTLFLDEIGDLPLEIQPKLLRLLQEREYERLGETATRTANVRVVAATNRNLKQRVDEGAFREDLYFRLNVIAVEMPPLHARRRDLMRFANHYLRHFGAQCGRDLKGFTSEAQACLMDYAWPGNLRELRNAIERAVILAAGDQIHASDLPIAAQGGDASSESAQPEIFAGGDVSLDQLEVAHIRRVLERTQSLVQAAEVLGIDQTTLYRKRKKMGLG